MLYASYVVAATRVGNKHTVEATRADKIRQQKKSQKEARALLDVRTCHGKSSRSLPWGNNRVRSSRAVVQREMVDGY